ncbi:MAG TPA: MMPL family transporter [Steroidobacteraceae bacterium]|nr:MMPL family transporter [Steroidobacteraceae bacterium]
MSEWLRRLARAVVRHPWRVLAIWAVVILFGAWGEHRLAQVTLGVEAGVPDSPSRGASEALYRDFSNPFIDPVVVAVSAPHLRVDESPYLTWLEETRRALAALPAVRRVASYADTHDARLRSADGHVTVLLVGPASESNNARQQTVVTVRSALPARTAALVRLDPAARLAVTGTPAADFDVNTWSASGGARAEKRALPLTLAILLVAFGTFVAASLPLLTGLATTTVSLGIAFLLASLMPVSNLLGNVVTMIGLAIGIDYSLLMATHYREHARSMTVADSVVTAVVFGGRTITWSGLTVIIGLLGLLFSPLLETRSVGIGGALVVCVSVLAALTLLPAALMLLGPRIEWLPVTPRRRDRPHLVAFWRRLGGWVVRHPLVTLVLAGSCLLSIAAPALRINTGFSDERWFLPPGMESRTGADLVAEVGGGKAQQTLYVIVRSTDGRPILDASHLPALVGYAEELARDPRVGTLSSPVSLEKGLALEDYQDLYKDPEQAFKDYPEIAEFFVSRDRQAALFQITPGAHASVQEIGSLSRELQEHAPSGPFTVMVAGMAAQHNDFHDYMFRSLPHIFGFVVGATLLLVFAAFRSFLLPVTAVLTNLLAVAAGIGAVVAIFQFGWLNALVGLEHPVAAIPGEIPLMVFCLSFGLSMDYELFLLFRVQQEYLRDHDNSRATVEGLAAVAPVITGAGLIMVVVFGAFIGAPLPVLKMTGVGLCVAVLVDATVVRALIVPATIALAGRWNWYPGQRPARGVAARDPSGLSVRK